MLKTLCVVLISSLSMTFSTAGGGADSGYTLCNCEEEGVFSVENILAAQRVSDLLIAIAYLSISFELIYFVSCSNVPFKWVLIQFTAFIDLCGLTHFINVWTYDPRPFRIMLFLTIFKLLTALVSCGTALTLFTLIPMLLKVKVREFMLRKKTWDLGQEVRIIKNKKDAGWHVRMLTQEIRKSLDQHTILNTTLVELSKVFELQNCAVWMPNEIKTEINLIHELNGRSFYNHSIPIIDHDVIRIKASHGVNILSSDSALGVASNGEFGEVGAVAAIRMPVLRVSNFKGGTLEFLPACYAILVLVLSNENSRTWTNQELEIVQVVADQVAVALSHAAVLEESQLMREKLVEQNRVLLHAKRDAMMANQARNLFHDTMSNSMITPMNCILGLLSLMQDQNLTEGQQVIVNSMARSGEVISALMNTHDSARFLLDLKCFKLNSMIKEVTALFKCLCVYSGVEFLIEIKRPLPGQVIGDERRFFQVILHMFGNLLKRNNGRGGNLTFRVALESESEENSDERKASWKSSSPDGYVNIRFEIGINNHGSELEDLVSNLHLGGEIFDSDEEALSSNICRRLVQLMQGNIWVLPSPDNLSHAIALTLPFRKHTPISKSSSKTDETSNHPLSNNLFNGLQVLLYSTEDTKRAITRKLLEKLGCNVSSVSSGSECLNAIGPSSSPFQILILDLNVHECDGLEVAMRIRKFRSRNWPLIVALTANNEEELWEKCLQVGINGVIRKPVLLKGLAKEFQRILQHVGYGDSSF